MVKGCIIAALAVISFISTTSAKPPTHSHHHGFGHSHFGHTRFAPRQILDDASQPICEPIPSVIQSQEDFLAKLNPNDGMCTASDASSIFEARQAAPDDDPYSCNENKPCANGACCAKTGFCGWGPSACGTTGESPNAACWSNCDAHAPCGRFADPPDKTCPLNVCCSQFGFCGLGDGFCDVTEDELTSCQSNCDEPSSGKSGGDVQQRIIGYYEAWNYRKNCVGMGLADIPITSITHLFVSFGFIKPDTYEIEPMPDLPGEVFSDIILLKQQNPVLKIVLALGGWTFNDNNTVSQPVFSDMVSTKAKRGTFIGKLTSFLTSTGFDGVDFDWEYPGAEDRGGHPDDGDNFTLLLEELQAKLGSESKTVVSFTAPTSYWYMRHFDMKGSVKAADFVNIMSYDLHGVWDGNNTIGKTVLAHTNLTEINAALNLLWRNEIDPGKVNLGLGFYGRAFQLADPSCFQPGCLFKGGASKGDCTDNSGTLSYFEIMDIIHEHKLTPYHDEENAVKYITWNTDQWVSYDDYETFKVKIDFANSLGLGGILIWAIDLDTKDLDALAAVSNPKPLGSVARLAASADNWMNADGGHCRGTPCGVDNCQPGEVKISSARCRFYLSEWQHVTTCCPLQSAPKPEDCTWRGGESGYGFCNGQCHEGEVNIESSKFGDGSQCLDGRKFLCCKTEAQAPACRWTGCGDSCNSSENEFTWRNGDCKDDQRQLFCCDKAQEWNNCAWHGKPGTCFDNHCETGWQVALAVVEESEGENCGLGATSSRHRTFCCDPAEGKSPFLPVPLDYLFEDAPDEATANTDFNLKVDPSFGGSVDANYDNDPRYSPFGFFVLASPENLQVSLDRRDGSHWDVFDCFDAITEEEQTVRMVCTTDEDDDEASNCGKIHLGHGVPGTILEMPGGCGPGKYAVAKSFSESANQTMPSHLSHLERRRAVYDLTFDYDFRRVPRDQGTVHMRMDVSNEPNYWDSIVDKAASSKKTRRRSLDEFGGNHRKWLEEEWRDDYHYGGLSHGEMHKRWFGEDILDWLNGILHSAAGEPLASHSYSEDFIIKIVDEKLSCPNFEAYLDIRAETHVEVDTNFGFTLIGTLNLPPDFSKSYLYFRNKGEVSAKFVVDAAVTVKYDTDDVLLFSADKFGAGFSVPGIVTVGPNFKLFGRLEAEATLGVNFEAKVKLAHWDVRQTYPVANDDWEPERLALENKDGTESIGEPEWRAGVSLDGHVTAHVKPTITFGIAFNKKFIDMEPCGVNLVADGYITFHASLDIATDGSSFCYDVTAGAELFATIDAPEAFSWALPNTPFPITAIDPVQLYPPGGEEACVELFAADAIVDRDVVNQSRDQIRTSSASISELSKRAKVWGPLVPHIPAIRCPGTGSIVDPPNCSLCEENIDSGGVAKRQDDDSSCLFEPNTCPDVGLFKRAAYTQKTVRWTYDAGTRATSVQCGLYPSCGTAKDLGAVTKWWGWEDDKVCNVGVDKITKGHANWKQGDFETDHVYEAQILIAFLNYLRSNPLPIGYSRSISAHNNDVWITQTLMGFDWPALSPTPVIIDGHESLWVAWTTCLGGQGATFRLALVREQINGSKGKFFGLATPSGILVGKVAREERRHQRGVGGVFSYMGKDLIWGKFTEVSQCVENHLETFDSEYSWGTSVGEIVRPSRTNTQPKAGLRDLYCYFIDQYLTTIEANAASWSSRAKAAYALSFGTSTPDSIGWLAHFEPGGMLAGPALTFQSAPRKHAVKGKNKIWSQSNYKNLWMDQPGFGAAGPF